MTENLEDHIVFTEEERKILKEMADSYKVTGKVARFIKNVFMYLAGIAGGWWLIKDHIKHWFFDIGAGG